MLIAFYHLLKKLEATPGKNDKVRLIRDEGEPFKKMFEYALSPYITFGIAQIPLADNTPWPLYPNPGELLEALRVRARTGNDAIRYIARQRGVLDLPAREAFDRILLKDLRCGVQAKTVNTALPGTVPVFEVQLAPSKLAAIDELRFPIIVEPKFDGVRTIAIKTAGVLTLFSRNGLEFVNFQEIKDDLFWLPDNTVLDGEVISPSGFQALMTRARAKAGVHTDVPLKYAVFDAMPFEDWTDQAGWVPQRERLSCFKQTVALYGPPPVLERLTFPAPSYVANSPEHLQRLYARFVELGYEGAMLKDPTAAYGFRRDARWQKLKPFSTVDLKVTGVVEGTGKYKGMMGALLCEGVHDGKVIRTEVGSGFSDLDRAKDFLGSTIEVRFQDITQAEGSDTFALRFPSYKVVRMDKEVTL